jgi:hypothetical protein
MGTSVIGPCFEAALLAAPRLDGDGAGGGGGGACVGGAMDGSGDAALDAMVRDLGTKVNAGDGAWVKDNTGDGPSIFDDFEAGAYTRSPQSST